ncbi:hypothetical protein CEUSTIGMA_g10538.t1 [Chlamydomonas eustigma]|uniref:Fe2OG dioxygenase domain-containing protein n=1 Tax=Chlamydomonas eustigma TaxID=1157962 RepID=A0A250XJM1_9CHLO|nr:hypothetical protein CEUSTIGMA_g10538.t1 [Chlamydomonas eustigma]|eukprot:GAX83112.1 hypothetical protein CEUSTIGMA_g10538.t1 [Chlamydomonas eustigma]
MLILNISFNIIFLIICLAGSICAEDDHELVGWLGETYRPENSSSQKGRQRGMVVLSWDPRIFLFKGFLTDEECDEMIKEAQPRLTRSGVSDSITGQGKLSDIRTSSGMFFGRGENELISRIEDRIGRWSMTNKSQRYDPHHDYFSHDHADDNGGNRLATGLMYLSDVDEGGETVFPKVPIPAGQTKEAGYSECAMKGLAYKPVKGDIVFFWSIRSDGTFDPKSLHGSCPVIRGQKWSATKWIHVAHVAYDGERAVTVHRVMYVPPPPPAVPGCINKHKLCDHWAESGECSDNPTFMIGSAGHPGDCIKACNRCDLGPNE